MASRGYSEAAVLSHSPKWLVRQMDAIAEEWQRDADDEALRARMHLAIVARGVFTGATYAIGHALGADGAQDGINDYVESVVNPEDAEADEAYFLDPNAAPDWEAVRANSLPYQQEQVTDA